jgi:raffinose/stachyose/melibiose transport system permease protein
MNARPHPTMDAAVKPSRRLLSPGVSRHLTYGLFALPAIVLTGAITLVPGMLTLAASLTDWDGVSMPTWAGGANFHDLFADVAFWRAIFNNVQWTVLFLTLPMAGALLIASLLRTRTRIQALYQVVLLLPYVLSPIVNVIIWSNIVFDPVGGLVGYINHHLFPLADPLAQPSAALYAVAAIDMWHFWGYLAVIFLGAIRQVPEEQLEAARLDGAGAWQMFRFVTLPNITPTIGLMAVMVTIFSFLTFDYVYLATSGGPGFSTLVLSVLAYNSAFTSLAVGRAAAVAVVMGLFGVLASVAYTRLTWSGAR